MAKQSTICLFCKADVMSKTHIGKCPVCGGELHIRENESECAGCGRVYSAVKPVIPMVVPTPEPVKANG